MPQKLSAMKYIKNNKRRVSVLIVSLALCFVLTYLTQFLLSTTNETINQIVTENTKKIQYIQLAASSLGIDVENLSEEEIDKQYTEKNLELVEKLKTHKGVKNVLYTYVDYILISPAVGNMTAELPFVEKEEIPQLLEHFGGTLSKGKMPEKPGELVMDSASMKNNDYKIGDYFYEQYYGKTFKIVGELDCDGYFGCGIIPKADSWDNKIVVLSEGIEDMSAELEKEGITVRKSYDTVIDLKWGKEFLKEEVTDVIGNSTKFIFAAIIILLFISLTVVYTTYLRDRHNEWCLYCSIGYSRMTIYLSIIRELLFTFAAALLIGGIIITCSVVILKYIMIEPQGLRCQYLHLNALIEILCTYTLLFGILQIPIRYALYRIRTIDALDDDLY